MQGATREGRSLAMDVTRVVACAMVVLVHTAAGYFYTFGPLWVPAVVFDAFSRAAVPIFFMLSGALLLWRDEPVLSFYKKRLPRIVVPLVFWTVVYVALFGDHTLSPGALVARYLMGPYEHLWYLYAAFGLYLAAPYLGRILRSSTEREIRVFLVVWFVVACVLNQVRLLWAIDWDPPSHLGAQLFSGFIGFFVLGAYLERYRPHASATGCWIGAVAFCVCGAAIAFATCRYSAYLGVPNEYFFSYLTPLVAISAASAYVALSGITRLPGPLTAMVGFISDGSLGIYCLHPMFLWLYVKHLHMDASIDAPWLRIPIVWAAVFASTAIVVHVLRKLPLARRVT
ncbi:MAG: O-acetyltransferase WecH [Luteibacter sp.]|nr:MAG: O-acetyltransferase WecH [Luteibacter sp.]